jgi:hypothetical protein
MNKSQRKQEITKQIEQVRESLAMVVESTHGTPRHPIDKLECSSVKLAILQKLQSELVVEQMFLEGELRALGSVAKTR